MSAGEKVFVAFWAILAAPIVLLSEGFCLAKLWAWYVIPTFGAPALTINAAIGLSILWGLVSTKKRDYWPMEDDSDEEVAAKLTKPLVPILIAWGSLLCGWIVLAFK